MATGKVDVKVVLLGKEFVGKTCVVYRYLNEQFNTKSPYQATIGAAFGAKRLVIHGKPIVMGIWDTAGSERYEAMSRIYYRGAKAAVVCYDITDKSSFDRVRFWVSELQKNESGCKVYLCGTKKDLIETNGSNRQVDYHDATDYADEINAELFETSSKTGENIGKMFTSIAEKFVEDIKTHQLAEQSSTIQLKDSTERKSKCKC